MKKCLFFLLLIPSGMMNTSCETEDICAAIYLADMVCAELSIAVPTVETGVAFALTTIIRNVAEGTSFCETATADSSKTGYAVKYRTDENSPWEDARIADQHNSPVFEVFVPTSPLSPNASTGLEPSFRMNRPGHYRFESRADGKQEIQERVETNNDNTSNEGTIKMASDSGLRPPVIVKVLAAPGYDPKAPQHKVEFLGYRKLW